MDYEKKYKEALELMKDCVSDENGLVHVRPCDIFTELEESEDERISKALIKLVKIAGEGYENVIDGVSIKDALAWLEKQGEQKPAELWKPSKEQMKWLHDAIESTQYEPRKQALLSLYSDLMKQKG